MDELLVHEIDAVPGAPGDDFREVSRYVDAMNHGLERTAGGFPLSTRLLREMHGLLLADGRGAQKQPGEFRRSQNWSTCRSTSSSRVARTLATADAVFVIKVGRGSEEIMR